MILIFGIFSDGKRKEEKAKETADIKRFLHHFEDRSVPSWHLQNNQGKMHFRCNYKTDTLSLIICIVGTLKAFRLEFSFIMFHIKITANEIIHPSDSKMLDFLIVNKCNSEKLFFLDRYQSITRSLITDYSNLIFLRMYSEQNQNSWHKLYLHNLIFYFQHIYPSLQTETSCGVTNFSNCLKVKRLQNVNQLIYRIYAAALTEDDSDCFLKNTMGILECLKIKNQEKMLEKKLRYL